MTDTLFSERSGEISGQDFLQQLEKDPWHFGFYAVLRELECQQENQPGFGETVRPAQDTIRMGQEPTLAFPASSLSGFDRKRAGKPLLNVNLFGLLGPNGPLPLHLTEYIRHRQRHAHDEAPKEFLDLFHHRLLSLFYRAWANKEPTVQQDKKDRNRFKLYAGSIPGLAGKGLQDRDQMPDSSKLFFAGHLGCQNKHAEGLASIIHDFLKVPVSITELVGEWLEIPEESYCRLGASSQAAQLSQSAIIGKKSWQCQHKFRIHLGPLDATEFEQLLPEGNNPQILADIVRNYTGFEFNWDVNLILEKTDVPPARLGSHSRLGWLSWLQHDNRQSNADDLQLNIEAHLAQTQHKKSKQTMKGRPA